MGLKTFSFRILAVVYGGLILLTCHFVYSSYVNHLKVAEHGALSTLDGIVSTLVLQIDGDSLSEVFQDFPFENHDTIQFQSQALNRVNKLLAKAQKQNSLSTPIYTLTHDSIKDSFYVGAASNGQEPYGFHYTTPPKALHYAYYNGGSIPPFDDDHGSWLSALHPIYNSSGRQIAALQADYPLDEFIMYAKEDAMKNLGVALLLFSIIGVFLFSILRKILSIEEESKEKLESARSRLEQKNEEVTSSIEYALTIQKNIYPAKDTLQGFFKGLVIYNRPRDIVSGDFYWFHQLDENRGLIAVADCTGHGVPGALMSIMGHNYLNDAVHEHGLEKPSEILEFLDAKICSTFSCSNPEQSGSEGMDVGMCLINKSEGSITFSGARRPLTVVSPNSTKSERGTRRGIGEHYLADKHPYVDVISNLKEEETYFLYSDGLQDQFGGEKSGKLLHKRLLSWLQDMADKSLPDQEKILQNRIKKWTGNNPQVDDICLIGFKVSLTSTLQVAS